MNDSILAIDIGSTKISSIVATLYENREITVEGIGTAKAQGIKKGLVDNVVQASNAIKASIEKAKTVSNSSISSAIISLSHASLKSVHAKGVIKIENGVVSIKEIDRVLKMAIGNATINQEYEIIHILPTSFKIDEAENIKEPFGKEGMTMEVQTHIIIAKKIDLSNLKQAVLSAGVNIDSIVINGYASALSLMSKQEKLFGATLIDLGGESSNLIVIKENVVAYQNALAVGSKHITNDLSMALNTPLQSAEQLKIQYGDIENKKSQEIISLPIIGNEHEFHDVHLNVVQSIIHSRVEETLQLLKKQLEERKNDDTINSTLILTGGMSQLKGIQSLAESIFTDMKVRIASPTLLKGMPEALESDATLSTLIGLLNYKVGEHTLYEMNYQQEFLHSHILLDESSNTQEEENNDEDEDDNDEAIEEPKEIKVNINRETKKSGHHSTISFEELPRLDQERSFIGKIMHRIRQIF